MTQREPFVLGYMAKGLGESAERRPRPAVEADVQIQELQGQLDRLKAGRGPGAS